MDFKELPAQDKIYYQDDSVVIYCADNRDILPLFPDKSFDLVLTDPPYGIADIWVGGSEKHGWTKANREGVLRNIWDREPPTPETLSLCVDKGINAVIWGGNYFELGSSRGWLVWNKPERGFSLAEAELAWTNKDMVIRVCDCNRSESDRKHPTQKPLKLLRWCLSFFPNADLILDPFLGSGTTAVAAKILGRKCIGIEISEKYCEIAKKRCSQSVMQLEIPKDNIKTEAML
jgi:DNA modification methylase